MPPEIWIPLAPNVVPVLLLFPTAFISQIILFVIEIAVPELIKIPLAAYPEVLLAYTVETLFRDIVPEGLAALEETEIPAMLAEPKS